MSAKKNFLVGCIGSISGIFVLFVGCAALFSTSYVENQKESSGQAEIKDTSWVPSGFNAYSNKVAYKWSEDGSYSCGYAQRCVQIEVVAKDGCDNLYAELSKLDNADNNVGYTNETTSGLAAGQKAILKFETYGDFSKFQLVKINCY
jgi:hypothetical protein